MKKEKAMALGLGIVTGIGGFLEVGSIATSAEAGALYGYTLAWAAVLGCIAGIFLLEMSGRLALVSKHTIKDAVRERFGFPFYAVTQVIGGVIDILVVAAETGGACLALQLFTGINYRWWAIPVALAAWALMWFGKFGTIQNPIAILGLVTLVFLVVMLKLHPDWTATARGCLPTLPHHDKVHYWFVAVSMIGAAVTPYLFYFYSSGAIEDEWDESYVKTNRIVSVVGMGFGSVMSLAIIIIAAVVFHPRGIQIDRYNQAALMLTPVYGYLGYLLFAASLAIGCYGALLQASMTTAYGLAQGLGWNWGEDLRPKADARFALTYTVTIVIGAAFMLAGIDPLKITIFSMALAAAILPLVTIPFVFIMNDAHYLGKYTNGLVTNIAVVGISILAFAIGVVTIPLELFGG